MKVPANLDNLINPGPALKFQRILFPFDFSDLAEQALEKATAIAARNNSSLTLVHVVEPIVHGIGFALVPPEMDAINLREMARAQKRLQPIRSDVMAAGVKCRTVARLGRTWRGIVQTAEELKTDLIVMATHGRTGLDHALLGSTAERVVQHAPCSVLILRNGPTKRNHGTTRSQRNSRKAAREP